MQRFSRLHNRYVLLRHGQREPESLYPGKSPSDPIDAQTCFGLTTEGRRQIVKSVTIALAKGILDQGTIIHASFLRRTLESAQEAANILFVPQEKVILSPQLRERETRLGEQSDSPKYYKEMWEQDIIDPTIGLFGVESVWAVAKRESAYIQELEELYQGKTILIVGHRDPLRILKQLYTHGAQSIGFHSQLVFNLAEIQELFIPI